MKIKNLLLLLCMLIAASISSAQVLDTLIIPVNQTMSFDSLTGKNGRRIARFQAVRLIVTDSSTSEFLQSEKSKNMFTANKLKNGLYVISRIDGTPLFELNTNTNSASQFKNGELKSMYAEPLWYCTNHLPVRHTCTDLKKCARQYNCEF
jgi:hypothetical protein